MASKLLKTVIGALHVASIAAAAPVSIYPDSRGITQVELTVDMAVHTVPGEGTFSARAYYYRGEAMFPGPTIYVRPGGYLNMTLYNNLGPNTQTAVPNTFHDANTTNVHTHGLHVSPYIDSVYRSAGPGETLNYYLPIPAEHHPGTHWYHAHHHGASTLQVMGGLYGMLIVEAARNIRIPKELNDLTEEMFIMSYLKFESPGTQDCDGRGSTAFDPFMLWPFDELEEEMDATPAIAHTITRDLLVVNGEHQPTITFASGESKYFRMIWASVGAHPKLSFTSSMGDEPTMTLVAIDGVFLDTPRTITEAIFVAGTRYDIVIECNTPGTYVLENTDINFAGVVATFEVSDSIVARTNVPPSLTLITKPYYLEDTASMTVDDVTQMHFTQGGSPTCTYWWGEGSDCSLGVETDTCTFSAFRGEGGTDLSNYIHTTEVGRVNEITLYGLGNEPHPFHVHVNHFQIVEYTPNEGGQSLADYGMELYEWRDTIAGLNGVFKLRFKAWTHSGEVIFHCHSLAHEDRGLMSSFFISEARPGPPRLLRGST